MKRLVIITVLLHALFIFFAWEGAGKSPAEQYIEEYKDLAISEMKRSGIPASIKLAQGMLESGNGQSRLARRGNNHFGIKCPGGWEGRTMRHDDDEENECFRVYPNVKASYRDHTHFLMNGWRYQELFELDPTDYQAWAHGLSSAGYATNPMYPQLLIGIIERHELYVYDRGIRSRAAIAAAEADDKDARVFEYNGIKAIVVQEGETYEEITDNFLYFNYQLARYNDIERGAELHNGEILYLKPKKWWPAERYHTVTDGETMHSISQMYGVRLSRLYRRNRLDREAGEEPAVGETINLRSRRSEPPRTRTTEPDDETAPREMIVADTPDKNGSTKTGSGNEIQTSARNQSVREHIHVARDGESVQDIASEYNVDVNDVKRWNGLSSGSVEAGRLIALFIPVEQVDASGNDNYHLVAPGDTLYGIAREYGVHIDKIREMNDLEDDNIPINMRLRIR